MAEWLSTDFFDGAESAARQHGGAARMRFGPRNSAFAGPADYVREHDDREKNRKADAENYFCGDELANEVKLQEENNSNGPPDRTFEIFGYTNTVCRHLAGLNSLSVGLDARPHPKVSAVND
jgi:hypothetical protein